MFTADATWSRPTRIAEENSSRAGSAGSTTGKGTAKTNAKGTGRGAATGTGKGSTSGKGKGLFRRGAGNGSTSGNRGGKKGSDEQRNERDSLVYEQDWLGDDAAGPGVLD